MSNGGLALEDLLFRFAYIFDQPYDIVHASEHRPAASLPAALLRKFRSTPYISDWADLWGRGGIMEERPRSLRVLLSAIETASELQVHKSADALTVISTDLYQRGLDLGHTVDRLLQLPNGVDVEHVHPITARADRWRQLGLPGDSKVVVYAGQAPIDMDLIWDAFKLVHERFRDAYLIILGRRWHIPDHIGEAADRIIQMGMIASQDYYLTLAAGDVLLLPYRDTSRNRGRWPGKLSFYLSVGRPVVANPTGDVKRLFEYSAPGLLAGESPREFAEAIGVLLSDPQMADTLGRNARMVAEEVFAWPLLTAKLSTFYRSTLRL
jgi:glycosyltransferase involved in cell wall biosynthesis